MRDASNWKGTFFKIYIGQAFSLISTSAVQFSIIWWITTETRSALALTLASVIGLLPQALIGLFAGIWIDRFPRKRILILADALVATSSFLLAFAFMMGYRDLTLVYSVLLIRALGDTFHKPALQAAIPQLVPSKDLTRAGGFGQMITSACTMSGPMLGALLMSIASLEVVMFVDVIGACIAIGTLLSVRFKDDPPSTTFSMLADIRLGLKTMRSNKPLMRLAVPMLISTIIFVPLGSLLPLMVKTYFNGTAWHNGLVQTLFSLGMLLSAMIISITGGLKRQFLMITLSTGLLGICALVGGLLPSTVFWAFCIVVFVMGTTGMGFNIPFTAYIQRTVPQESLGKVISLITSIMSFAAPVGMFVAGPISEAIGVSNWMRIAGIVMLLVSLLTHWLTHKSDANSSSRSL